MSRKRRGPAQRWVVGPEDPKNLGELLHRMGRDEALGDGCVFVAGRRAEKAELSLSVGDVVEIGAGRPSTGVATILATDDDLVAADKPPELPTEPDRRSGASLRSAVARALSLSPDQVHALSRLDLGVSGVVLLATGSAGRERVERLRESGGVQRRYLAIASAQPEPADGIWGAPVDGPRGRQAAQTRYHTVAKAASGPALLAVEPVTGRTHQIRVHAAGAGTPLLGDRAHGGPARVVTPDGSVHALGRIALHASWVKLADGFRAHAPPPGDMVELWSALGGDPSDFARAAEPLPAPPGPTTMRG